MNIDILIQARLGSTRFPRKVLAEANGKPLIQYLLHSMALVGGIRNFVVLAPKGDHDLISAVEPDPVWVGDELDVASRFIEYVEHEKPDAFVRVCADSPLLDWLVVSHMVEIFTEADFFMLHNVGDKAGFPAGQHCEIVDSKFFLANKTALDREHVTPTLHFLPRVRGYAVTPPSPQPGLVVDTPEDFIRIRRVIEMAGGEPWKYTWRELQQWA